MRFRAQKRCISIGIQESNTTNKLFVWFIVCGVLQLWAQAEYKLARFSHAKLGTTLSCAFFYSENQDSKNIELKVLKRLAELETCFSTYVQTSELNQLTSIQRGQSRVVSHDLMQVLKTSKTVFKESGGAFSPAVAAWTKAWKEGRGKYKKENSSLKIPDFKQMVIHEKDSKISFQAEAFALDLGGIAKGYMVDEIEWVFQKEGIERYLISLGGETKVGKAPPKEKGWTLILEGPNRASQTKIQIENKALSSSGSSYQFYWRDGEKISHIYDPQTNSSLNSDWIAYVISEQSIFADAWSTVLSIQKESGLKHFKSQGLWGGLMSEKGWVAQSEELSLYLESQN